MPIYEYQGQQYDISDTDPVVAKNKILKYLGNQEVAQTPVELPKPTASDAFEQNLLSPLMGLSRLMGGVSPDAHSTAVQQAEESAQENPVAGFAGKLTGMIGPSVPLMATAPVLAPALGLGGVGAGVAVGVASAPQVGSMAGAERYQSLLNAGAPEEEAKSAAITEGVVSSLSNAIPTRGGLLGRMAQGAGINVASGIGSRAIQNEQLTDPRYHRELTDPKDIALDAILGGAFEAVGGSRPHERLLAKDEVKPQAQSRLDISDNEKLLAQDLYKREYSNLLSLQEEHTALTNIIKTEGDASTDIVQLLTETEARLKRTQDTVNKLESILANPNKQSASETADNLAQQDIKLQQLKEQLKAQRQAKEPAPAPRQLSDEEITSQLAEIDGLRSEPPTQKVSPFEVAMTKIGQASSNPKLAAKYLEELQLKIEEASARPDSIGPGGEYNAKLQAMLLEQRAYQDIISGKQPDLTALENTHRIDVEAPTSRELIEGDTQPLSLEDHATIDASMRSGTTELPPVAGVEHTLEQVPLESYDVDINRTVPNKAPIEVGDVLSAKQTLQKIRYDREGKQRTLDSVVTKLNSYETAPSGTLDVAALTQFRKSLEEQIARYDRHEQAVLRTLPVERKQAIADGNANAFKAEESIVLDTPKYKSIQDILSSGETDLPLFFDNNLNLFNKVLDKVYFDNTINKLQQKIISHFIEKLGLNKEKIYFVNDKDAPLGRVEMFGNTAVIKMNIEKANFRTNSVNTNSKVWGTFLGDKMETASRAYFQVRVAAHELGHLLLHKYLRTMSVVTGSTKIPVNELPLVKKLQDAFDSMVGGKTPVVPYDITKTGSVAERQKYFHEFFAEQVAKELLYKHTLGAFSKGVFKQKFDHLLAISKAYLQKHKVNVDETNFARDIVTDLIADNAESIQKTGKTIFENFELQHNDKQVFAGMSMEQMDTNYIRPGTDWHKPGKGDEIDLNPETANLFSVKTLNQLISKIFGKNQVAQIFKDNPHIQRAYDLIRQAESIASSAINRNWHGSETYKDFTNRGFLTRFNKIKDGDSPYHVIKQMSDDEAFQIKQIVERAWDEKLSRQEALAKYGGTLSEKAKKAFNTLDKLWDDQANDVISLQTSLKKKHVLEKNQSWFPNEREGEWFFTINLDDATAYRQHFPTRTAAEAAIKQLEKDQFKHLTISSIQRKSMEDVNGAMEQRAETIESVLQMLKQKYPKSSGQITKDIQFMLNKMSQRGGKAGMHQEERSNILGYKGSELNYSSKDQGRSFKEAIIKSVDGYAGTLRSLYLRTKLQPLLESTNLDAESKVVVQQMMDSAMSRNRNLLDPVDTPVREGMERAIKQVQELFGKQYTGKKAAYDTVVNNTMEMLYLLKIMAKGSFILSQPMSSLQSIRHMSYDGGYIKPWLSYGKGLYSLVSGDKELSQALYLSKTTSHTFEPQFIDALHLTEHSGPIMSFIKDWVMLRKPAEMADTLSRVTTFAGMFKHYRDAGHSFETAVKLAEHGTDSTMVTYGNRDTAPVFQHAGMLGAQMRPLQTFPTAALGNLVADLKNISTKDLKSYAPFINYALSTIVLSGVMGLQFVAEYEMIRKYLEDKNPGSGPPAIADLLLTDPTFEDRIDVDPTAVQQAVLLGLPTMTGVDLSSSLRANEAFATTLVGVYTGAKGFHELLPLTGLVGDVVGGTSTLAKAAITKQLGIEGYDLSVKAKNEAITKAAPAGAIGYGLKEYAGVNETKLFGDNTGMMVGGKDGEATTERTTTDKVAGYLGTKSTNDRTNLLINLRKQELDKRRTESIKKNANLFVETGKQIFLDRLESLDVTDKQLENTLGNTVYKKLVDQRLRYMTNKQGKVNEQKAQRSIQYGDLPE